MDGVAGEVDYRESNPLLACPRFRRSATEVGQAEKATRGGRTLAWIPASPVGMPDEPAPASDAIDLVPTTSRLRLAPELKFAYRAASLDEVGAITSMGRRR
jgi:hypothetical protein